MVASELAVYVGLYVSFLVFQRKEDRINTVYEK